jgi:hypothetical protein
MTDKEVNETKLANEWKNRIDPLIRKVDSYCLPQYFSTLKKWMFGITTAICVIFSGAVLFVYFSTSSFISSINKDVSTSLLSQNVTADQVSSFGSLVTGEFSSLSNLLVCVAALIITLFVLWFTYLITPSSDKEIADSYYRKISLQMDTDDMAYLKALINMKSKEMTLSLQRMYSKYPELFSKESLLKSLYD